MVHISSYQRTFPPKANIWELDAYADENVPFYASLSLIEMIVVGFETNMLLPWIHHSNSTYNPIPYEIDHVHLEQSEEHEEWKGYVDLFELHITC